MSLQLSSSRCFRRLFLSSFPPELLNEIVHYSSTPDLLTFCQISKQFYIITVRLLYRVVLLAWPVQAIKFCRTILTLRVAAFAVRRFTIAFPVKHLSRNFFGLIAKALARTVYLEALDISNALPLLVQLGSTSFRCLTQCSLPYSTKLVQFLKTHQRIQNLAVQPPTRHHVSHLVTDEFPCILLPRLETYVGPSKVAQFVTPFSNVCLLTIFWDSAPPDLVVHSLALSKKGVHTLDNVVVRWDPALFTAIATCLPGVVMLRIRNANLSNANIEPFFENVLSLLPKFRSLINFSISHIYNMPVEVADLEKEYKTVVRWGQVVPTLQICTLQSGTKWSRFRPGVWFPDKGGLNAEVKAQWLFHAILAVKYPLDMYADLQSEEGRALVSRLREFRDQGCEFPVLMVAGSDLTDLSDGLSENALPMIEHFFSGLEYPS